MKRNVLLLIFAWISLSVSAADFSAMLNQAKEHYSNAEYEKAIELYTQVVELNREAPELYFNLGNSYYKTGKFPQAILYYEKALRLNPNDEDLIYNLEMANQFVTDKFETVPTLTVTQWYNSFLSSTSSNTWSWASILCFSLFLVCAALFLTQAEPVLKKTAFGIGIVLFLFAMTSGIFASQSKNYAENLREAIVFEASVTVKSTPDNTGTELFVLHEGTKVKVVESVKGWRRIKVSDGNVGWLRVEKIAVI